MKTYYIPLLLCFFTFQLKAQMNVLDFESIRFGAIYDKTDVTGFYTLNDPNTGITSTNLKDYIQTTGFEAKYVVMSETGVFTANLEGFLYLAGRLIALKDKNELFFDWDTYLDPLTAGDLHKIKYLEGPNYNDVAKISNNHLFDMSASWAFKRKGALLAGINLGCRTIGFPPRYTFYEVQNPSKNIASSQINGTWKILFGLNLAYRKNLGSKASLFVMGGVNTGLNKSENETSTAIQVKYNPFFSPTLYFGGRFGAYVGLHWEYMKGEDQTIRFTRKQPFGTPEIEETVTNEIDLTQLQIKLGINVSFKK